MPEVGARAAPAPVDGRDFEGAVRDVMDSVAAHQSAVVEAEVRQRPRARWPILAAAGAVLAGLAVFDVWLLTRPPSGLPPELVAEDLRWTVGSVAGEILAFRHDEGRLPAPGEISDLLDEDVRYEVGDDGFVLTGTDDGVEVRYDGSVPLERWILEGRR